MSEIEIKKNKMSEAFKTIYNEKKKYGDCLELVFAEAFGGDQQLFDFIFNDDKLYKIFKQLWLPETQFNVELIGTYDPYHFWSDELAEEIFKTVSPLVQKKILKHLNN